MTWTPQSEQTLIAMHEAGVLYKSIAFELGTSISATRRKATQLGLTKRRWTPHRARLLTKLHEEGLRYSRIAAEFGVSTSAIAGAAYRLKLERRPGGRRKKEDQE